MKERSTFVPILMLMFAASIAWARSSYGDGMPGIPDNSDARKFLAQTIIAPTDTVLSSRARILSTADSNRRVKFEVQQTTDAYYLLFLNEQLHSAGSTDDPFPIAAPGNYVIKRSKTDGSYVQIKVFLQDDPDFFVRIFPDGGSVLDPFADRGGRSFIDVYLAGVCVYRGVVVPISFGQALTAPFQWVMEMTQDQIDWALFFPPADRSEYSAVESMVGKVRAALPTLPDAEDGAMDQNGHLVYIASLVLQDQQPGFNCSGFAKWVADGLYRPATGHYLSIDVLKQKHPEVRGNRWSRRVEDVRDPYFGLDWTRNIAVELMKIDQPGAKLSPTSADVRSVPFSHYVPNVGYPIARLKEILYLLAVQDPGYFYLGSVNKEYGTDPVLRQHTHVVVLFPYFTPEGTFRVALMERNVESTLGSLDQRYPDDFIHLVRVRASSDFTPPIIVSEPR